MAACVQVSQAQGYQCAFVDKVDDDLCCNKCKLVARDLTVPSCCGESFCLKCIESCKEEGKPCHYCNGENFTIIKQVKFQKRVNQLQVYCSLKDRGCEWQGTLEDLALHVDPDQDKCQYVDTKCPLNCQLLVPRNQVENHTKEKCVKREFFCKYCNFKATYEIVTHEHLPQCKYFPVPCPNMCGVTCEREHLEDHLRMCRLEEVRCDFEKVGCDETFHREEQDGHLRDDINKHLLKTADLAVENKTRLAEGMDDLRKEYTEEIEKLSGKVQDQEDQIRAQHKLIEKQKEDFEDHRVKSKQEMDDAITKCSRTFEDKLSIQEKLMAEQERNFGEAILKLEAEFLDKTKEVQAEVEKSFAKEVDQLKNQLTTLSHKLEECEKTQKKQDHLQQTGQKQIENTKEDLSKRVTANTTRVEEIKEKLPNLTELCSYLGNYQRTFEMKEFSKEKEKDKARDWKSPSMYTHSCGYKFCVGLDANGRGGSHGKALYAELYVMPGEYDSLLRWPAKASFTLELLHPDGKAAAKYNTAMKKWEKPELNFKCLSVFPFTEMNNSYCFMEHAQLKEYIDNDMLKFRTSVVLH